jgi:Tat protein secretion system quality control protein TatD with DNase activity
VDVIISSVRLVLMEGGRKSKLDLPNRKVALDVQIEIFTKQLQLAYNKHKFVSVHCVYEWDKLFKTITSLGLKDFDNMILLHSFQAEAKLVERFKTLKCWFSISPGCINEKNYKMLKSLPLDNIVLESDAPSMFNKAIYNTEDEYNFYPIKDEKTQNHPMSILQAGRVLSEILEIGYDDLMKIIAKNSKRLISKLI